MSTFHERFFTVHTNNHSKEILNFKRLLLNIYSLFTLIRRPLVIECEVQLAQTTHYY